MTVKIEVDMVTRQAQANADAMSNSVVGLSAKVNLAIVAFELASKVVVALGGAFVDSAKNAIAFEKGLAGIKTIAQDANLDTLRKELLDISSAWGFDELSAATAQYDLISSGFTDTADAAKVLSASAALATAGMGDLGGTAKVVAVAINAFSLSAADADKVTDVLTKTTQFGVTTLNELGPAFGQVASIAAGAKVSLEETSAAMATITLTGKTASESATGLKSLLSSLLKPSDELAKAFKNVSDKSIATSIAQDGLGKTLELVRGAIGSGSDSWIKYLGSVDAASAGITLASGKQKEFKNITEAMNDTTKKAGEATREMAEIVKASASNSIDVMNQSVKNLGTEIVSVFEPAIAAAAKLVTEFVVDIKEFVRENEAALRAVGRAAVDMVRDFGEFVKAIVASEDLKRALFSLRDIGVGVFDKFTEAFGKFEANYVKTDGALGKFADVLNQLKPIIEGVATALGTWVGWVVQISTILPRLASEYLPRLADGFTKLQQSLFGFTGLYDDSTKKAKAFNDKLIEQENITKLGTMAFGEQKKTIDPIIESYIKLSKPVEELAKDNKEAAASFPKVSKEIGKTKETLEEYEDVIVLTKQSDDLLAKSSQKNAKDTSTIVAGELRVILTAEQQLYDSRVAFTKNILAEAGKVVSSLSAATSAFKDVDLQDQSAEGKIKLLDAAAATANQAATLLKDIPGPVGEIGSMIAGLASLVFQLPEIIAGIPKMVEGFIAAIPLVVTELLKAVPQLIIGIIEGIPRIVQGLVQALPEIIEALLKLMIDPAFWLQVMGSLIKALLELLNPVFWLEVAGRLVESLLSFLPDFGQFGTAIWEGIKLAFKEAGKWLADVGSAIWEGLKSAVAGAGETLLSWGSKIWDGLKSGFDWVINKIEGLWNSIKGAVTGEGTSTGIPIVGGIIDGVGDGLASIFGWSQGGLIPGKPQTRGDSYRNDTVPALLSPGEMVIPRSAMDNGMAGIMAFAAKTLNTGRGASIPQFAMGGMVAQSSSAYSGDSALALEVSALRADLQSIGYAIAKSGVQTYNLLNRWDGDDLPRTRTD